jgi:hypothetical protein
MREDQLSERLWDSRNAGEHELTNRAAYSVPVGRQLCLYLVEAHWYAAQISNPSTGVHGLKCDFGISHMQILGIIILVLVSASRRYKAVSQALAAFLREHSQNHRQGC